MKLLNVFLFAITAAFVGMQLGAGAAIVPLMVLMFVVSALLSIPRGTPRLCATLSATEILQDTLDAFKLQLPMLQSWGTNFSPQRARLNDQIIAHVSTLPAVQDYDATTGYRANAAEASSLLTDVPVTLNRHKHVPVKIDYIDQLSSFKNLYNEAIKNYGYVLAKSVVDYVLTQVLAASVTQSETIGYGGISYDSLELLRTDLNLKKASPSGRFGLVNSTVAQALAGDIRITSRDYYGQTQGAGGYRTFRNVAGFDNIYEYPDLPDNGEQLSGFFGDRRAIAMVSRVPNVQDFAASLGIPSIASFNVVTDPDTGLSLMGIGWQEQGTFDAILTVAILYGVSVGAQGGAAGAKTDYAGLRLKYA